MFEKAISRYVAKVLSSQLILLVVCLLFLFFVHLLSKQFTDENVNMLYPFKECNDTIFEAYPEEPTLEDCEKIKTCSYNFCYSDVAEINGNLDICEKVLNREIKLFCIAKVTLNSTKCLDLDDIELRQTCLESIQMKTRK